MFPSEQARRRLLGLAAVVLIVGTTSVPRSLGAGQATPSRPPADSEREWMNALAVKPGSSLPAETSLRQQKITFFQVSEQRAAEGQYFIAGMGYAEVNGGGTFFSGMNRAQDHFLEVTILPNGSPALEECLQLLSPASFEKNAVRVSGVGYFAKLPGVQGRQLGIFRLDTLGGCTLVSRY